MEQQYNKEKALTQKIYLKSTNTKSDNSMPLLGTSNNSIAVGPEKCNLTKAQNKNFKMAITNILLDLKSDMN